MSVNNPAVAAVIALAILVVIFLVFREVGELAMIAERGWRSAMEVWFESDMAAPARCAGATCYSAIVSTRGRECNRPHAVLEPPHESAACDHSAGAPARRQYTRPDYRAPHWRCRLRRTDMRRHIPPSALPWNKRVTQMAQPRRALLAQVFSRFLSYEQAHAGSSRFRSLR